MTTLTKTNATITPTPNRRYERQPIAVTGAAFALLVVLGNAIYTEGGNQTLGYSIELLGYAALAVFLAWIAVTFRAGSRSTSALAVIGGAMMLTVKLSGYAVVMASKQAALTPDVTEALVAIDEQAFVAAWFPFGLFVIGLALAAMRTGHLPRVVAWIGVALGIACVAAVPFSRTEPFVLPWMISLLWLITASTLLVRGRGHGDQPWSVEV